MINGAAGGVGTLSVTRNLELVRSLGADRVLDYTGEDFTKSGNATT